LIQPLHMANFLMLFFHSCFCSFCISHFWPHWPISSVQTSHHVIHSLLSSLRKGFVH
jgi:hypothetical protein